MIWLVALMVGVVDDWFIGTYLVIFGRWRVVVGGWSMMRLRGDGGCLMLGRWYLVVETLTGRW